MRSKKTSTILKSLEQTESRSMQGQMPIVWNRAEGHNIFDIDGKKFIDFTSTIFVANTGHGNPEVIRAIKNVLNKPLLHTYAYVNEYREEYLRTLINFSEKFEKAFLLSAGTEATEAALKLMRMNSYKIRKKRPGIICFEGNWHGRTMGAQMMCSNSEQKEWIGYIDPNIHHLSFPYPWITDENNGEQFFLESLNAYLKSNKLSLKIDICGFMLETFQGWGAVFYPKSFVQAIRKICDENEILLCFDEMQSGFARTGKKFGYEHYDVKADLICCGKGMASGFPLSAVMGSKQTMDLPSVGNMSSTHSANPISCAAGLATIAEIERLDLVKETQRKGIIFFKKLKEIQDSFPHYISHILGKGLIAAIIFNKNVDKMQIYKVCEIAMKNGLLLVHTGRESIKIGPPLTITDKALQEGLDILNLSIREAF